MSLSFSLELPRRDFTLSLSGSFEKKTTGIFGRSGAGKTSFFNLLCGLEKPAGGRIELNGRVLADTESGVFVPPWKRRTAVVFQNKLLFPHLTVRQNLLFGTKYAKHRPDAASGLEDITALLGLESLLDSYPAGISGGEQQRTAIGRALLSRPELLLLDEPFSGLDETIRNNILPYLRRVRDELDIPMLIISHRMSDIQHLTDNIYLIEKGRCTGHGLISDLIAENHDFAKNTRLLNNLELNDPRKLESGLYSCLLGGSGDCRIKLPSIPPGKRIFLSIHPDEISLSLDRISGISIQNQIKGEITEIIRLNGSVYCKVNCGTPIIARVTMDAITDLGLEPGKKVYCLFKSNSLRP